MHIKSVLHNDIIYEKKNQEAQRPKQSPGCMCIKDCALSLTCQKCSYYAHVHRRRPRSKCTIPSLQCLEVSLYRRTPVRGVRRWRIYYEYCPFRKIVKFYNSGVSNSVCLLLALAQRKGFKNVKYFLNKLPYEFPRHYT